jgi:hypothetical protein
MSYTYLLATVDETVVDLVWGKARAVPGLDAHEWRKDSHGKLIYRPNHGLRGPGGWEIDYIIQPTGGCTNDLDNLEPLHWQSRRSKALTYPSWKAPTEELTVP